MKAEIGSNFWEYNLDKERKERLWWETENYYKYFFKSGRNAMKAVCEKIESKNKTILLPAYLCETEVDPWRLAGWNINTYQINKDFSIDLNDLSRKINEGNPGVVLVQSYFGFVQQKKELCSLFNSIKNNGTIIIEDITQNLLTDVTLVDADIYVASLRKFYAIPDGGVLISRKKVCFGEVHDADQEIDKIALEAYKVKYEYFKCMDPELKIKFRSDYVCLNEKIMINDSLYHISQLSNEIFKCVDFNEIKKKRNSNYSYLYSLIKDVSKVTIATQEISDYVVPLYLSIYVEDSNCRDELRRYLASEDIYCPVIWPKLINISIDEIESIYIYDHILCIPIDQRYDKDDMRRIYEKIRCWSETQT